MKTIRLALVAFTAALVLAGLMAFINAESVKAATALPPVPQPEIVIEQNGTVVTNGVVLADTAFSMTIPGEPGVTQTLEIVGQWGEPVFVAAYTTNASGTAELTHTGLPVGSYAILWDGEKQPLTSQGNPGSVKLLQFGSPVGEKDNEARLGCTVYNIEFWGGTPYATVIWRVEIIPPTPGAGTIVMTGTVTLDGDGYAITPDLPVPPAGHYKLYWSVAGGNEKHKTFWSDCVTAVRLKNIVFLFPCGGKSLQVEGEVIQDFLLGDLFNVDVTGVYTPADGGQPTALEMNFAVGEIGEDGHFAAQAPLPGHGVYDLSIWVYDPVDNQGEHFDVYAIVEVCAPLRIFLPFIANGS